MGKDYKDILKKENAALDFISLDEMEEAKNNADQQETEQEPEQENEEKSPLDFKGVEKKSKRLNLLIRPTIHAGIKKAAKQNNVSMCELINLVLADFLEKEEKER